MIKATIKDKNLIVTILSESFDSNKSVNYVAKQDEKRLERIRILMEYSFHTCLAFGEVFLSDDKNACALLLYPENKKTHFKALIRLVFLCIGITRITKVLEREAKIKSNHPDTPMAHLWFMGVMPYKQGRGIGGALLKEIIRHCNNMERPIYLETSTVKNIPFYKKYGFEIMTELDLTYPLYILKRDYSLV